MIRRGIGVQGFVSAGGTDADAQAFITAAGITDATQQSAINTLVTDLKGYGIWTKMKAIYPFVGGTSSTHKWNLKDPRDLDAAFRLVFSGGWTHSSTGALPNGTNGYADSFLIPSTSLSVTSGHLSFYSRNNFEDTSCDFGSANRNAFNQPVAPENIILSRYTGLGFVAVYGTYNSNSQISNSDSRGYYIVNRNSSTNTTAFKNNTKVLDFAQTSGLSPNSLTIGCENLGTLQIRFSSRECAFASIGDGLTDTEAANLNTAVQAYQTTLSRNV